MENYILETKNLTKIFAKQKVVDNISLKIKENSIYALLGLNGAGKSTTLKLLTGLLHPTSGQILFENKQWKREALNHIGALIETPAIYGNLTAIENLKVYATILDIPESRIHEVLKIVNLEYTGKKKASKFSLGMKQRLGIAIALLNNPKLLILDEPTNGLDPIGIQEFRSLIKEFPPRGITVILSTHILSEVEQIADYVGIINNGKLEYECKVKKDENLEDLFMNVIKKSNQREEILE